MRPDDQTQVTKATPAALTVREMYPTQEENMKIHTEAEVQRAKEARELIRIMGFPGRTTIKRLIGTGGVYGTKVTQKDIDLNLDIFGVPLAVAKGKTKAHNRAIAQVQPSDEMSSRKQDLHADVLFVESVAYCISVSTPMGMTMITKMAVGRNKTVLRGALKE